MAVVTDQHLHQIRVWLEPWFGRQPSGAPIAGKVNGTTGAVIYGAGFTSARSAAGRYDITLTSQITNPVPVITPAAQSVVSGFTVTSPTVIRMIMSTPAAFVDSDFAFAIYSV